ncbi:MAG: ISKra4 family transposase, partial [Rhodopila sp.]
MTLAVDTAHIRAVPTCQGRTFEIVVAQTSNDHAKHRVFASVPDEAYHQAQQRRGVLHELGATKARPVTIRSDGAAGPRALARPASLGPTHHGWTAFTWRGAFTMSAVKAWPDDTAENRAEATRLADGVEAHIRWRLWHGQVQRALDLMGETLAPLEAMANDGASPTAVQAGKVAKVRRGLDTDVSGQSGIIIDYAKARRCGEPISTASTESTGQWLLHRRMSANQQMRCSPRGAHLMLKVRTAV